MILIYTENKTEREIIVGKHYKPFDAKHGFKNPDGSIMTPEQVEQFGVLVESIPEPMQIEGKVAIGYINCFTKEIWYEYIDAPPRELTIDEKIAQVEQAVLELSMLIAQIGGAD